MAGTILVPVAPGPDTSIPTGTQLSAKFTLTGPDGTRAVFNDQTDRDYVGMVKEITGLDSPEVRESADDLVQQDGGIHGNFFYGRRPVTLSGILLNPASADARNRRMTKLQRASSALRGDATLAWALEGGYEQFIRVRRQQPLRISGGWQKEFLLAMVSADPRIYDSILSFGQIAAGAVAGVTGRGFDRGYDVDYGSGLVAGSISLTNYGNALTYPLLTVYGPGINPILTNFTTGESIYLTYNLGVGDRLTIDTLNHTVTLNDSASRYGAVDFALTSWWGLVPDANDVRLNFGGAYSAPASLAVSYRNAWI